MKFIKMRQANQLHQLVILLSILVLIDAIEYDKATQQISTSEPITSETMYDNYPNLWLLDMSNQTVYEFPVNRSFLAHVLLVRFICNRCSIKTIYRESLTKVPSLTHLELTSNGLAYIHPDAFKGTTRLESLLLMDNLLTNFNPEAELRHLPQLATFDLSCNVNFDINKVNIFMKRLISFNCQNCSITFLNRSTMAKMPRLYNLSLPDNHLKRVEDNTFAESNRIRTLNVDGNKQLKQFNISSTSLMYLSVQRCSLEGTLDTSNLPQLEVINFRWNRLKRINEQGFVENANIRTILADSNEIENIPSKLLTLQLNHSYVLCLDSNPLQPNEMINKTIHEYRQNKLRNGCLNDHLDFNKFEYFLPSLNGIALYTKHSIIEVDRNAVKVDFSNKNIVVIEQDYFEEYKNVQELLLDDNIAFDFKPYQYFLRSTSIIRLSVRNCSVARINKETFRELPNLQYINLESNKIRSLPFRFAFPYNTKLEWLSLARNQIQWLHSDVFENLDQLNTLILDGNQLLSSSPGVDFLTSFSLKQLSCNECGFSHLDNVTVAALRNLKKLELAHNEILTIAPKTFQYNAELECVNLQGNKHITFEPETLKLPRNLMKFCLDGSSTISTKYNESHVEMETIKWMIRLQDGCDDTGVSKELLFILKTKKEQATVVYTSSTGSSFLLFCVIIIAIAIVVGIIFVYYRILNGMCKQRSALYTHVNGRDVELENGQI